MAGPTLLNLASRGGYGVTGETSAEPVTAVLLHHDTDLYDLTIKTAHGTAVIDTTASHLFWDLH